MSRVFGIVVLVFSALVARARRLFRLAPPRSTEPEFVAAEVGAVLPQLALSQVGRSRLTVVDCLAAVAADRRTCAEDFVIAHLRAAARACKPLRTVVPFECQDGP